MCLQRALAGGCTIRCSSQERERRVSIHGCAAAMSGIVLPSGPLLLLRYKGSDVQFLSYSWIQAVPPVNMFCSRPFETLIVSVSLKFSDLTSRPHPATGKKKAENKKSEDYPVVLSKPSCSFCALSGRSLFFCPACQTTKNPLCVETFTTCGPDAMKYIFFWTRKLTYSSFFLFFFFPIQVHSSSLVSLNVSKT